MASRWTLAAALGATVFLNVACMSDPDALLLDHICDPDFDNNFNGPIAISPPEPGGGAGISSICTTGGDAKQVAGITNDAIAFHFGPSTGSLSIHLSAFEAIRDPTWSFDVLARSTRPEGSELFRILTWSTCAACPPDPSDASGRVTQDYSWVRALNDYSGMSDASEALPNDAVITLRGADIDIVNVRTRR
jgi:hypothetical protein